MVYPERQSAKLQGGYLQYMSNQTNLANKIADAIRAVGPGPVVLDEPSFSGNEWLYLKECLDSTFVSSVGKFVNVELAMGDGVKKPSSSEARNKPVARKSLVASRAITAGEVFTAENITTKRPGNGISPMRWDEFIGQAAQKDYQEDELI